MAVILQELYEDVREEEEIRLVAGEAGMHHIVRWVHMVEGTDISSFLEGDEVAFTTGIALHSEAELLDLVKYNYRQQAAGMVINVGPYIAEIPAEVLAFAEEKGFPIFCVPWRVHMANIMRYFTTRINLDEQKTMELEVALKNAFYFPENTDMYIPMLLKHGYKKEWSCCAASLEVSCSSCGGMEPTEKKKLLYYGQEYFHAWQKNAVVLENGEGFVFLGVNVTDAQLRERVTEFCSSAREYEICAGDFYGGVGRAAKSLGGIGKSFAEAEQVKRLQRRREQRNAILSYRELGLYQLLFSLEGTEVLEDYYKETIGVLEKHDRVNETDYCYFLRKYFEAGCSVQTAAARLHLHRNSVTYKLHKIEEILKMSVSDPSDRTKIMVALMIQEIR